MRVAVWSLGVLACTAPVASSSTDEVTVVSTPTGETGHQTTVDVPVPEAPEAQLVFGLSREVGQGGWFYANFLQPVTSAYIGRTLLEPHQPLNAESTHGVWQLPADLPLGSVTVTFTGAEGHVDREQIEVMAPWFRDVAGEVGLTTAQRIAGWPINCARSLTAVGVADVDLDGRIDVLQGNLTGTSTLWLNRDQGTALPTFEPSDALPELDLVTGVSFADWDNDGDQDVFVGRRGPNRMFRNDLMETGTLSFVDVTGPSRILQQDQRTVGAAFGDYDGDGLLDLYEVNHVWCFPTGQGAQSGTSTAKGKGGQSGHNEADHLYRNLGDGRFLDTTRRLPDDLEQVSGRFGFSAIWLDLDRNGTQDLWVVNDHAAGSGRSVLFRNLGPNDGGLIEFVDASDETGIAPVRDSFGKTINGMGGDLGDVNKDGHPDFVFSNIGPNFLMQSVGDGTWEDASDQYGLRRALLPWSNRSVTWATHLFDVDNDADLDPLFVGGTILGGSPMPHALFENLGDGTMQDVSWTAGVASPGKGHSSALVDLDRDGWLDWIVANWAGPPEIWRNELSDRLDHHWLVVELEGDGVEVNRDGLGAIVELVANDGRVLDTCWRHPRPSMAATGEPGCHFGLGTDDRSVRVRVTWPGQERIQLVQGVPVDTRVRVVHAP
ncbi:MAG: CRTAC1 family protein [Myxococcales bacterium]|nr:CRTAC1 family protein [Myxococcales bacterium]